MSEAGPGGNEARGRFRFTGLFWVAIVLLAIAVCGIGWTAFFGSASDGSPVVVLPLSAPQDVTDSGGVLVPAAPRSVSGHLVADPALLEETPGGVLPKIGADGRMPEEAYARPFDAQEKHPRIALVVTGLGLGTAMTELALSQLPAAVTLAFLPNDPAVQAAVDEARAAGHEVLVEVPMEPFDFPESNPELHMLMASASAAENDKRLDWTLSRMTGYVGIANFEGGRFLAQPGALEPVMAELAKRGLIFFDDGGSARSVSGETARRVHAQAVTATTTLDDIQIEDAINAKFQELEVRARESGASVGVGSLYPITLERIVNWAATLEERGFVLAPLSAVAQRQAAMAAASGPVN